MNSIFSGGATPKCAGNDLIEPVSSFIYPVWLLIAFNAHNPGAGGLLCMPSYCFLSLDGMDQLPILTSHYLLLM